MDEAPLHAHNRSRNTFIEVNGVTQPAPAPRFSRTPPAMPNPPTPDGDNVKTLVDWGFSSADIAGLRAAGAL
jgi:alpha-methylacyl-CoA racemase